MRPAAAAGREVHRHLVRGPVAAERNRASGATPGAFGLLAASLLTASSCGTPQAAPPDVQVKGSFSGTVSAVAVDRSALCLRPDPGSAAPVIFLQKDGQACSVPMVQPGSTALKVGDHVTVAVELIPIGHGNAKEVFLVVSPPPAE